MAKDPVCGMDVNEQESRNTTHWEGKTYHFCSDQCKQEFQRKPHRYTAQHGTGHPGTGKERKPGKKYGT